MNKHKNKHHPSEEAKKIVRTAEAPAQAGSKSNAADSVCTDLPSRSPGHSAKAEPGEDKLKKANAETVKLKDQLIRLQADFDNFRKRSFREKTETYEIANETLMLELLPVIDHIQLAIKSAMDHKADAAFQEGLQLIADQLMNTLSKFGLEPFDSDKQPFDPNLHEAINYLPSETEPEGIIITQSRQGYRFKNKILRPAQVVVSSGPPKPAEPETENQLEED